jgi:PAS domain S-box-containing protein
MLLSIPTLSSTRIITPALAAGVILVAFIGSQYFWERRKRRRFRQALESSQSQSRSEPSPDTSRPADDRNPGPALRGLGAPQDETESFPAFGKYFIDHVGRYGLAVFFLCVALLVRLLLDPALRDHLPYGFFLLAVIATALATDIWETSLALVVGFLLAMYFFVEPPGFRIAGADAWWGAGIYFTTGLGILWFMKSEHTAWLRALDHDIAYFDRLKELDQERAARRQAAPDRELLASIVESTQDAVLSVTLQGRITTWNAAAGRLFGYSAREAIGQPLTLILPHDHAAQAHGLLDQINRGQRTEQLQAALRCKDGSNAKASLTLSPVNDGAGKLIGASVIARAWSPKPSAF